MDRECSKSGFPVIGFTVGVWDLFHEGHKVFLEKAAVHCENLVIGVMTDYWVMVQKGDDRPIQKLDERMKAVCSYGYKVLAIDTLDMSQYLQMSDIWIKSKGQNKMRSNKYCPTVYIPRTPDISTTRLINERNSREGIKSR